MLLSELHVALHQLVNVSFHVLHDNANLTHVNLFRCIKCKQLVTSLLICKFIVIFGNLTLALFL